MPPAKRRKVEHDWTWSASTLITGITLEHQRRAAGLVGLKSCKFIPFPPGDVAESSSVAATRMRPEAGCTEKGCKGNPLCYNHLGVEQTIGKEAKEDFIQQNIGEAPICREKGSPAGLRNMGATCYANAFLQLWFHIIPFRNGLNSCELKENSKIFHLVKVLAALQYSKKKVVDPSGLVEALGLRTDYQQDAGEFAKLFLGAISLELKSQKDPALRDLPKKLFDGKLEYVTKCDKCHYESRREEPFSELTLSLKNGETLQDRIKALCQPEQLTNDNRWQCPECNQKRDATRTLKLKELPEYLNFNLMRFAYDIKSEERKKNKATIRYPKSMTLKGVDFDLSAMIVHLGSSPYSGHFITEVYNDTAKKWFTCNDEEVTPLVTNINKKLGQPKDGLESTKDAYMLIYKRKSFEAVPHVEPPEMALKEVREENEKFEKEMEDYLGKCELAGMEFETVKSIKEPVISSLCGDEKIIPRDELSRWLKGDMESFSTPITYDSLLCPHALDPDDPTPPSTDSGSGSVEPLRLDPSKTASSCRLISQAAFNLIQSTTSLLDAEICLQCTEAGHTAHQNASSRIDQIRQFDILNQSSDNEEDGPRYMISKSWLDAWRKNSIPTTTLPSEPGFSLYCGHGNPWPGNRSSVHMSAGALELLQEFLGDFELFTTEDSHCPSCSSTTEAEASDREAWLLGLKADKFIKREINPNGCSFNTTYYILPERWLSLYRNYLITPSPRPPYSDDLCPHGGINVDPNEETVDYITLKGWELIKDLYGEEVVGDGVRFIFDESEMIGRRNKVKDLNPGVCEDCTKARRLNWENTTISIIKVEDIGRESRRSSTVGKEVNETSKPSSSSTITSQSSKPHTYSEKGFGLTIKRTQPSRSTTSKKPKPHFIPITPITTVKEIRNAIYHGFQISHICQSIWYGDLELSDPDMTMKEIGMISNGELRVVELKEDEDVLEGGKNNGTDGGFGGTALMGGRACKACTLVEYGDGVACSMCDRPFEWDDVQ